MKLLLTFLLCSAVRTQNYYQGLMDYLENRLLAMEDRMKLWNEEFQRHHTDMLDFKKQTAEAVEGLRSDHKLMLKDLNGASSQVDRVEGEMDYVASRTSPRACGNKADRVVEQEAWGLQAREDGDDWEDVNVSDCVEILSSIRSVKILKRVGSSKGVWTRDPRSSRVYVFNGTSGDSVYQFPSVRDFARSLGGRNISLPSRWSGLGSAVYDGFLYYVQEETDVTLVKYDLESGSVAETAMFPVASRLYGLNPETAVELAVDGEGLWLLFAGGDPNISLAKLDPGTLDTEQVWDTGCPQQNAEAAFIACGTVYVVYNTRLASRSRVQCLFDVNEMVVSEEAPLLYFPRRFGAHASLKYNPEEKQLYGWDDGYQIIYRLTMKKKLLA